MRDKNLTYQQLNIQLEKMKERGISLFKNFSKERVIITPTLLEDYYFSYPRDYRLLRSLVIFQWYLPMEFHFRIWLDLTEMSFSHLNEKQRIELSILLSSQENCNKYLYETKRYTGNEIFGNILGTDLKELCKKLKVKKKNYKLVIPERRRGYNDHGSLRPFDRWIPDSDFSLTEQQLLKEKEKYLIQRTIYRTLQTLENLDLQKKE